MKTKIDAIRRSIETGKPIKVNMNRIHILNKGRCVNSYWVATWIAKKGEEDCDCGFKCKIRVLISRNNDYKYEYVVDKSEMYKLLNP